jgi:hypothetical protein
MSDKSLYNEYGGYTVKAIELCNEVHQAMEPILVRYRDEGFSLRETCGVVVGEVVFLCNHLILKAAFAKKKLEHSKGDSK